MNKHKLKQIFFLVFIFLSVFLQAENKVPVAHKGTIDLGGWDFDKDGAVVLNGEWDFFWNRHVLPSKSDSDTSCSYIIHPLSWTKFKDKNGFFYPAQGCATLRLKICNRKRKDSLALSVRGIILAYSVWADGVKICQHGNPTTSKDNFSGRLDRQVIPLPYTSDTTNLVIHVSNYFNSQIGGFYDKVELDLVERAILNNTMHNSILMICFGALLFMSVFHIILYFFIQKEKINRYFSLVAFFVSLMSICNTDLVMHFFCVYLSPGIFLKCNFVLMLVIIPFFAYHQILFPHEIKRIYLFVVKWIYSVSILLLVALPMSVITDFLLKFLLVFSALVVIVLTFWVIKAFKKRRRYSKQVLPALILLSFIVCNDVLYFTEFIHTGFYSPIGSLLYLVIQSVIISYKLGHRYKQETRLKLRLEKLNLSLETKVAERTRELEKTMKEHAELEEARRGLIHMVIHDIKNSLQAVVFLSVKKEVLYAAEKMMQLVQNMLDIERFEQSKMPVNLTSVQIRSVVDSSISQTKYLIDTKQIGVSVRLPVGLCIEADHNLLERVLINLLNNAIHHSRQNGKVSLDVDFQNRCCIIEIADEGSGIPPEYLEKVFDKYHSVGKSKYKYSTGLGLAFCKQAIESHSGTIFAKNNDRGGASFVLSIPQNEDFIVTEFETNLVASETDIIFSDDETALLSHYVLELRQADFYESSDLIKIIDSIPDSASSRVSDWKNRIRKTVFTGNIEDFERIIGGI